MFDQKEARDLLEFQDLTILYNLYSVTRIFRGRMNIDDYVRTGQYS